MHTIRLKSPAKVNLYLKVLRQRNDGYHQIKTVFERINLCDDILLRRRTDSKIKIVCDHCGVPKNNTNLIYKAAELLKNKFNKGIGVDIRLKKRIPVASGLGGGSSNAASTLIGLNKLWNLGLSRKDLLNFARNIGSDVPFFVSGSRFAIGTGRGDRIKPIFGLRGFWHILIVPRKKLSSKKIYSCLNLRLTKNIDNVKMLIYALRKFDLLRLKRYIVNDLEKAAIKTFPKLFNIKKKLDRLGVKVYSLTGSGPAIFGIFQSRKEAEQKASKLKSKNWQVFVARTY
jgi:4-diphosphocytidyl-2-C-methyl-D-erythritol kinase